MACCRILGPCTPDRIWPLAAGGEWGLCRYSPHLLYYYAVPSPLCCSPPDPCCFPVPWPMDRSAPGPITAALFLTYATAWPWTVPLDPHALKLLLAPWIWPRRSLCGPGLAQGEFDTPALFQSEQTLSLLGILPTLVIISCLDLLPTSCIISVFLLCSFPCILPAPHLYPPLPPRKLFVYRSPFSVVTLPFFLFLIQASGGIINCFLGAVLQLPCFVNEVKACFPCRCNGCAQAIALGRRPQWAPCFLKMHSINTLCQHFSPNDAVLVCRVYLFVGTCILINRVAFSPGAHGFALNSPTRKFSSGRCLLSRAILFTGYQSCEMLSTVCACPCVRITAGRRGALHYKLVLKMWVLECEASFSYPLLSAWAGECMVLVGPCLQ